MPQINDAFYEQLYARKKTIREYGIQALIFIVTIVLSMISFTFCITNIKGFGLIMGFLCICILVYFGYKLFMKLDVEYEYIYLNGEIDVDKIICRTKAKVDGMPVNKRIDVRSNKTDKLYYAVFNHREYKKTLLIFEPEERILEDMKRHIQRSVWH